MITIKSKGSFDKSIKFLGFLYRRDFLKDLNSYGQEGVEALRAATPVDTGKTANSWYYEIRNTPNRVSIRWCNSNLVDGVPVAVLIQYGHATENGRYVRGTDFINPAIRPIFEDIAERIWRKVTNA